MSDLIFNSAVRSLSLLGLGVVLWPLLPKQHARWRRRVVLGFLVSLLVVPFWPVVTHAQATAVTATISKTVMESSVSWLGIVWLLGTMLAIGRLTLQICQLRRVLNIATFLRRLDLDGCSLDVMESGAVVSPCVTGWTRPVLLVPPGSAGWTHARWQCVLWHERQHAMQHDVAAIWLVRSATALYWWNPLVYLAARQFHAECEAVCDSAVLNAGATPRDYVETLLSFSKMNGMPAISIAGKSSLRRRIERFLENSQHSKSLRWRLALGVMAAVLAVTFSLLIQVKFVTLEETPMAKSPMMEEVETRLTANPFPSGEVEVTTGSAVRPK